MSILFKNDTGWFISHLAHLKSIYRGDLDDSALTNLEKLFDISSPFAKVTETSLKKKRKRKGENSDNHEPTSLEEIEFIRKKSNEFLEELKVADMFSMRLESASQENNAEAQEVAKNMLRLFKSPNCKFNGGNSNESNVTAMCHQNLCIFPPKCRFFNSDIREMDYELLEKEGRFNAILMDPPWWNKYIRRKRKKCTVESYDMLYNEELLKFPMNRFLDEAGVVLIWCTNAPSHILELSKVLLPAWNLEHIATWYWLKVTKSGDPVCPFSEPCQKQPFERIIIASRSQDLKSKFAALDKRLILSVPSAIHSHKPPLIDILKDFLPESPRCLEIFARYLLPGWTSVGNEVLRLQCSPSFDTDKEKTQV
nr:PREDICTED: methyltransferase-like protein 4 [Bemisia tabaci]